MKVKIPERINLLPGKLYGYSGKENRLDGKINENQIKAEKRGNLLEKFGLNVGEARNTPLRPVLRVGICEGVGLRCIGNIIGS